MPAWLDVLGGIVERTSGFWLKLGNVESSVHRHELDDVSIDRPIYIAGLARSGSTILLELLAGHPEVVTHRYRDFPPVYTPVFWNRAFAHIHASGKPVERAHKDRILVTPDSPEAMEEVIWRKFFPSCDDPTISAVLDASTRNRRFERFYEDHVRKILLIRGGRRYLSKGNYNVSRLAYVLRLFPHARFIVPVRDPRWHVASLMKQHRLFCEEQTRDPRIRRHMRRVGHFEFGLDRRPINLGDAADSAEIAALWASGEEVRGWSRYWSSIYRFVSDRIQGDPLLRKHVLVVRYEDLCEQPRTTLESVFAHAELELAPKHLTEIAARLSYPRYYTPSFSDEEEEILRRETAVTSSHFGYA